MFVCGAVRVGVLCVFPSILCTLLCSECIVYVSDMYISNGVGAHCVLACQTQCSPLPLNVLPMVRGMAPVLHSHARTYVCTYIRTHRADCEIHAVMCCAQMYQRVFECKFLQETEVLYHAKGQEMVNSEEFTVSG